MVILRNSLWASYFADRILKADNRQAAHFFLGFGYPLSVSPFSLLAVLLCAFSHASILQLRSSRGSTPNPELPLTALLLTLSTFTPFSVSV